MAVAALFGVIHVRGPPDRDFVGAAVVIGEDAGVVVGVGLPV
jgi:hypothetical protein